MNEQFIGEKDPAPEKIEEQKYAALQEAINEEESIMKEIDGILASTPNREEAEKIVLEKYASQMDEAMKKSRQALDEWLEVIKEADEIERE